jgi:hypothetical protein
MKPKPKPKLLRVVLADGEMDVVAFAEDPKAALVEAFNPLSMQTELKAGWTLRVEEEGASAFSHHSSR